MLLQDKGDLPRIVEPDGRETRFRYDEHRRLAAVTHPDSGTTTYTYGQDDRLTTVDDRGVVHRYHHDAAGRLIRAIHGRSPARVYRYDSAGRLTEARAGAVTTRYRRTGDTLAVSCSSDGVTVAAELEYGPDWRLRRVRVAGAELNYAWDDEGRFASVESAGQVLAGAEYADGVVRLHLGNGLVETREHDPADHRPRAFTVTDGERELLARRYEYRADGRLAGDGVSEYAYDPEGRLIRNQDSGPRPRYDARGRVVARGTAAYRYDDADRLVEAREGGVTVARMAYDHAGRLVRAVYRERAERYLYGLDGTLLAVTDDTGAPVRIPVRAPVGVLAELRPDGVRYPHAEHTGTVRLVTGADGTVLATPSCGPHGDRPSTSDTVFHGRAHVGELGLYDFGYRWYDPELGRFLTQDSHTGRPDDARLVHPFGTGRQQVAERGAWLPLWLGNPHERDTAAFCCGDPVNRVDPDGHWSFGWVLLSVLGAVWTLPNTLLGILLEITCLVVEPIRWLLTAFGRTTSLQPVGFETATSGKLNAFALVFLGGWMGTLLDARRIAAITFGNTFFVNRTVSGPTAVLYEHELRHTNQYGWFGPLFLVVYLIDCLVNGYSGSLLELDAQAAKP
jgi:RHS repeat-associated protein